MFRPQAIGSVCLALVLLVSAQSTAAARPTTFGQVQPDFSLNVKYGVLVGLTGDAATGGQAWNQAVKVAVDYINQTLQQNGYSDQFAATLVDSQDSEGNAQRGVEAAQKLVAIQIQYGATLDRRIEELALGVRARGRHRHLGAAREQSGKNDDSGG